jgi:hypothetical protein
MKATNWKDENVRHTRGGSEHYVSKITIYKSFFENEALMYVAGKHNSPDGHCIKLEITNIKENDLIEIIEQCKNTLEEMQRSKNGLK